MSKHNKAHVVSGLRTFCPKISFLSFYDDIIYSLFQGQVCINLLRIDTAVNIMNLKFNISYFFQGQVCINLLWIDTAVNIMNLKFNISYSNTHRSAINCSRVVDLDPTGSEIICNL
jgi:hypothetical protein